MTAQNKPKKSYDLIDPDQHALISRLYEHDYTLVNVPVGFGKTVCTLTAVQELLDDGELDRVLVVAPIRVCKNAWGADAHDWEHLNVKVGIAVGSAKKRLNVINDSDNRVVVINFENLAWFCKTFGKTHGFDGLVVDELTKLAAVGAVGFKKLRPLLPTFQWRVGLTATPVENGLERLYAMCLVLDLGATFGRNKERFLETYFYPVDYERRRWAPKPDSVALLAKMIAPFTFTVDNDAYEKQLPKLVEHTVMSKMSGACREVYKDMAKDLVVELEGQPVRAVNNAVKQGKLQQLCSGFLYSSEDEDEMWVIDDVRVEAAVRSARANAPAIVVYQFTADLERLQRKAERSGMKYATLGAGVTGAKSDKAIEEWNAGKLDVLFIHPKSAGHGLNMQFGGNAIVFCGPIWSKDSVDQVIGRLRRRGSPFDTVRVVWVLTAHSVETAVMMPRLKGRGEVAQDFFEHLLAVTKG